MKKTAWLSIILFTLVCLCFFTACEKNPEASSTPVPSQQPTPTTTTTQVVAPSEAPEACMHEFGDWISVRAATCQEKGLFRRCCRYCTKTQDTLSEGYAAHKKITVSGREPTCILEGITESVYCSGCGQKYKTSRSIPKVDHAYDAQDVCVMCKRTRSVIESIG